MEIKDDDIQLILKEVEKNIDRPTTEEIMSAIPKVSKRFFEVLILVNDFNINVSFNKLVFWIANEIKRERAAKADTPNHHQNNNIMRKEKQEVI